MSEDKEIIDAFGLCFQESIDKGFQVDINKSDYWLIDFNKVSVVNIKNFEYRNDHDTLCFLIIIYKNNRQFNIKDIIEYLLFTESYMKDIFNLNIGQLYTAVSYYNSYFYKNIEYLPIDKDVNHISIWFNEN